MKKVVFALEVFSIIAVFLMYVVLEISHETANSRRTVSRQVVKVENSKFTKPVTVKFKEQDLLPFPQKLIVAFLKVPSSQDH